MLHGWNGWFMTFTGVTALTLLALPLAGLAVWLLTRRRRSAGIPSPLRRSLAEVGIGYGTVPLLWMLLLPDGEAGAAGGRLHLVPLQDLLDILADGPARATGQILGNLLVFAALGFFAPLRFAALASVPRVLVLGAGCSIAVEVAQYLLRSDRVSSIDDVLLNAAGAALAALASRRWWRPAPVPAVEAAALRSVP